MNRMRCTVGLEPVDGGKYTCKQLEVNSFLNSCKCGKYVATPNKQT